MISKLRSNYKLSNVLIRIAFPLAYVLYSWQTSLAVSTVMMAGMIDVPVSGLYNLFIALMTSAALGVGLMFLTPFIAELFLNISQFYSVPRKEYGLLTMLFFTLFFAICGVLKLINLFTPILLVWGEILFPVLVSLACAISFYCVTAKLYFNTQTKPYYFRNFVVAYVILAFLAEVLL